MENILCLSGLLMLSGMHGRQARPQVALVLSIENGDPSSFEAYGIHPLAHDTPFTDMIYTFIRRIDWEAELTSSDAFTARVSSSASRLTSASDCSGFLILS